MVSRTVRVTTPSTAMFTGRRFEPSMSRRCRDGLRPTSPQHAAGMRIDPPPSLACAIGTTPAATRAAAPPEEPPGVRSRAHGFLHGPKRRGSVVAVSPNSGVALLPRLTSPAASRARTIGSLRRETYSPELADPQAVRTPRIWARSFTKVGTPARGPVAFGAASRARSKVFVTMAFSGATASARAHAASTTSAAETSPRRMRSRVSTASHSASSHRPVRMRRHGIGFRSAG